MTLLQLKYVLTVAQTGTIVMPPKNYSLPSPA